MFEEEDRRSRSQFAYWRRIFHNSSSESVINSGKKNLSTSLN